MLPLEQEFDRLDKMKDELRGKKVLLALSGGIASGTLAHVAKEAGADVLAVTIATPFTCESTVKGAELIAAQLEIEHRVVKLFNGTGIPHLISENNEHRCYYCKKNMLSRLETVAREYRRDLIVDGTNSDDDEHFGHNGFKALEEHPVFSPWRKYGFSKSEIREVARGEGLDFAEKSFHRCLATRMADELEITKERLALVKGAESALRDEFHLPYCRVVLHHNDLARISVPLGFETQLVDSDRRGEVTRRLKALGFRYVTFDLDGLEN
ncbi:MAG: ATP-dependent sacrificial sulfur transferase LarE [Promethearchaeota archaeon]